MLSTNVMAGMIALIFLMNLCQSVLIVLTILPSSPAELAIRWFVGARNTNVMASTVAIMAVTKIPLSVTTAIALILPCAGMAAPVSFQVDFVTGRLNAAWL